MTMKKFYLLSVFLFFSAFIYAQIPQALTYQAVARNAAGSGLINTNISVRISIKDVTSTGPTLYSETHAVTTNQFGLFTVAIGTGLIQSGVFANIDWAVGSKFMKVEMDATGGSNYIDMGTSQLLSVPYAMVAGSVLSTSTGDDWGTQTAITNTTIGGNGTTASPLGIAQQGAATGQTLKWNGSQWAPANDAVGSGGDNWGTQSVITNSTLTGAGTIASPIGMAQQGATTGQTLKWNGTAWAPANDIDNDAQSLTLVGSSLTISNGNTVTLPSQINYSAGAGVNISGNVISNTGDLSNTNELQTLSVSGNQLTISNGNTVTVNAGNNYTAGTGINVTGTVISNTSPDQIVSIAGTGSAIVSGLYPNFTVNATDAQILSITGTQISISNGNSINIPTQTVYTAGSGIGIAGNVITNTSLNTDGQTLSISGSTLSITGGNSVTIPLQTPYTAGTGIGIAGTVISNLNPDQTVVLTGGGATAITGTYPNFTITSTDTDTDAQTISLSGNDLSILNGNTITLPAQTPYTAGTGIGIVGTVISNSAPDQTVALTGTGATTVSGVYPNFTINSTDTDTDAQTLSLAGSDLSILNGNTITLPAQTPYTAGTGIGIAGTVISNLNPDQTVALTGTGATTVSGVYPNFTINSTDTDTDAQTLSLAGNDLSILNGNTITLPTGSTYTAGTGIGIVGTVISNTNPDQTVILNGTGMSTVTGSYPTFSVNSIANTDATLSGNGTLISPLKISQQGASVGDVLVWNGTTWVPGTSVSATTSSPAEIVYSTGSLNTNATWQTIPGLIININVPATGTYKALIAYEGGAYATSPINDGGHLALKHDIDGTTIQVRSLMVDSPGNFNDGLRSFGYTSVSGILTPGPHTIIVQAYLLQGNPVSIGAATNVEFLRCSLSVVLLLQ